MIEQVFFSKNFGQGIIADSCDNNNDFIKPIDIILNGEQLTVGAKTTVQNFFKIPLEYVGIYKGTKNLMVFYLGEDNGKKYYDCYYKIDEKVIFKKYKENSGRTFNYIKNKWK
jgi:hypothetical protein